MVDGELEINEDQNDVDLSLNDSNQLLHAIGIWNHVSIWYLISLRMLKHVIMHMQGERGLAYEQIILEKLKMIEYWLVLNMFVQRKGFVVDMMKTQKE